MIDFIDLQNLMPADNGNWKSGPHILGYVQFRLPRVDCVTNSAQNTRVFLSSKDPCSGINLCRSCIRYHRSKQTVQKHQDLHSQIGHVMCSHPNHSGMHMKCRKRTQAMRVRYMTTPCRVSDLVCRRQILQSIKHSPRICVCAGKKKGSC